MKIDLNILEIISILVVVCLLLVIAISIAENRKLQVTRYRITHKRIPKAFHGFKIVQISDLHNARFGNDNVQLIEQVRALSPDLIVVTGDMIVGKPGKEIHTAVQTMNALAKIAPVYFSLGNHELRAKVYGDTYGDMWTDFIHGLDPCIQILDDASSCITRQGQSIQLHGITLTPALYRRLKKTPMREDYLTSVIGTNDPMQFHIFLAHNPLYFKEYTKWGANLVFSGHVHGGMIRLPFLGGVISPMLHLFPRYDRGLFEVSNQYMILSGGLGNHTFKIRVNNIPEIVSVTLENETM